MAIAWYLVSIEITCVGLDRHFRHLVVHIELVINFHQLIHTPFHSPWTRNTSTPYVVVFFPYVVIDTLIGLGLNDSG